MVDLHKLKEEQLKLAKKVITKDSFEKIETIAGCDQAFIRNQVISGIVVLDPGLKIIEKKYAVVESPIPYIPEFLSYREAPAIVKAYELLENKPDLLMVDAHGILHPRRIGMASHVGILLDIPTIGIAKGLLTGTVEGDKVTINQEIRGIKIESREHAKPLFVSPGHKISLKTAVEIVKKCIKYPHKLPEPLHIAHRYVNKVKENLEQKGKETSSIH